MKIYFLFLLLGTIAAFAQVASMPKKSGDGEQIS